jgi:ubiquinone/menaquinone biosynthesis C-methylase UbiE
MSDVTKYDTAGRFDGLANLYGQFRPDYPEAAIDFIVTRSGLRPGSHVVDVGCGTGISTRQMAARGVTAIGVEPNAQMRAAAEATAPPAGVSTPTYRDGRAEFTGLPDGIADLVLAAQAFHWFRHAEALSEFRRILKPTGRVVLMWNEQDRTDPFTAGYNETLKQFSPDPELAARTQCLTGEHLLASALFSDGERVEFPHLQELDVEQLLGRAFSASYAPQAGEPRQRLEEALRRLHASHQRDGRAAMRYRTTLYVARAATPSAAGRPPGQVLVTWFAV